MKTTPDALAALIGQRVDLIDTPALVVDLDAMDRNIQRMADFARKHQVRWRPHAKMHKSAELALLLQQAGAQGVCVQKVSEAEALAAGGVLDITITNEVIAMPKLHRVARMAALLAARGGAIWLNTSAATTSAAPLMATKPMRSPSISHAVRAANTGSRPKMMALRMASTRCWPQACRITTTTLASRPRYSSASQAVLSSRVRPGSQSM